MHEFCDADNPCYGCEFYDGWVCRKKSCPEECEEERDRK